MNKFCLTNLPEKKIETFSSQVHVHFVKGALKSSFTGSWSSRDVQCKEKYKLKSRLGGTELYRYNKQENLFSGLTHKLYAKTFKDGPSWNIGKSKSSRILLTYVSHLTISDFDFNSIF